MRRASNYFNCSTSEHDKHHTTTRCVFFAPFKNEWRKTHKKFCLDFSSIGIRKNQLATVLEKALNNMDIQAIMPHGFRKCGLKPFNVEAVDFTRLFNRLEEQNTVETLTSNPEATMSDVSCVISPDSLLKGLENLIPQDVLADFQLNTSFEWKGIKKHESLFEVWFKLSYPDGLLTNLQQAEVSLK